MSSGTGGDAAAYGTLDAVLNRYRAPLGEAQRRTLEDARGVTTPSAASQTRQLLGDFYAQIE